MRQSEAVHGGGVHGSGVWTTERALNDWHLQNSIKYAGPFHPEYYETAVPISKAHAGLHDADLDFKTAVRGIVPGYAGHVPRVHCMQRAETVATCARKKIVGAGRARAALQRRDLEALASVRSASRSKFWRQ